MGVALVARGLTSMDIQLPNGAISTYRILQVFPFTSESKRMGIIVKVREILLTSVSVCLSFRLPHPHLVIDLVKSEFSDSMILT